MQTYTFLKVFFVLILNLQEYRTEIELLKRNLKKTVLLLRKLSLKFDY
jgi:hypothetical protein